MYYGNEAYATTTGSLEESVDGFNVSDYEPWLTVACKDCGEKINEAINDLVDKENKKRLEAQFNAQMKEKEAHRDTNIKSHN